MSKYQYEVNVKNIAEASCNSVHTVRDHIRDGILDMTDLASIAAYITHWRCIHEMRKLERDGGFASRR